MSLAGMIASYVDKAIKSIPVVTAVGTVVTSPSQVTTDPMTVVVDGSANSVPVKQVRGMPLVAGARVVLVRFGSDWVIVGAVTNPGVGGTNASSRIVIGADTPPELKSFGIDTAILSYVTSNTTGLEVGYFWIGTSNRFDGGGDNIVQGYGNVRYPIPGDPTSATFDDVMTNMQTHLYAPYPQTVFKDQEVQMWTDLHLRLDAGFTSFSSGTTGPGGSTVEMPRGMVESGVCAVGIGGVVAEVAFTAANWGAHEPNMTFYNNHIYRADLQIRTNANASGDNAIGVRLRKGSATLVGQQLWRWDFEANNLFASGCKYGVGYIKNVSGANITTALSITLARTGGGNQVAGGGDANTPMTLTFHDMGVRLNAAGTNVNVAADRLATAIV